MEIFNFINGRAMPNEHTLLIEPFKTIWERDVTPSKGEAIKIFTYIELVSNPRKSNPFAGYSEKDRPPKVRKEVWGDPNYNHPQVQLIIQAVLKYKSFLEEASPTYSLLVAALNAMQKLRDHLNSINLNERTLNGTAVTKPADVTRALKEIPDVDKSIKTLMDKVNLELEEEARTRKSREIGYFEE